MQLKGARWLISLTPTTAQSPIPTTGSLLYLHGHSFVLKGKSKQGVTVLLGFVVHLSKGSGVSDTT